MHKHTHTHTYQRTHTHTHTHTNTQQPRWIIFSDLHVKGSSIDTCQQVLEEVHAAALERNAGIIFLGDFWHVRGALNVELLNRVLKSLGAWTQPVIMIPGKRKHTNTHTYIYMHTPIFKNQHTTHTTLTHTHTLHTRQAITTRCRLVAQCMH